MMNAQNLSAATSSSQGPGGATIFKIPIGRLGLIARVMMGGACGFIAFFVTFFFAIIGVAIYDSATARSLENLNISYLYIAAPVGVLALLASLAYLLTSWVRRKIAGAE